MFLQGFINANLEPIVENIFLLGREGAIPLEAILDTGFNGMLCLPVCARLMVPHGPEV